MADTLPNCTMSTAAQTLSSLTGGAIPTGSATRIQNVGVRSVYYAVSATAPPTTNMYREIHTDGISDIIEFGTETNDIWLWCDIDESAINAEVI